LLSNRAPVRLSDHTNELTMPHSNRSQGRTNAKGRPEIRNQRVSGGDFCGKQSEKFLEPHRRSRYRPDITRRRHWMLIKLWYPSLLNSLALHRTSSDTFRPLLPPSHRGTSSSQVNRSALKIDCFKDLLCLGIDSSDFADE
jgi:hypothetical protein